MREITFLTLAAFFVNVLLYWARTIQKQKTHDELGQEDQSKTEKPTKNDIKSKSQTLLHSEEEKINEPQVQKKVKYDYSPCETPHFPSIKAYQQQINQFKVNQPRILPLNFDEHQTSNNKQIEPFKQGENGIEQAFKKQDKEDQETKSSKKMAFGLKENINELPYVSDDSFVPPVKVKKSQEKKSKINRKTLVHINLQNLDNDSWLQEKISAIENDKNSIQVNDISFSNPGNQQSPTSNKFTIPSINILPTILDSDQTKLNQTQDQSQDPTLSSQKRMRKSPLQYNFDDANLLDTEVDYKNDNPSNHLLFK